MVEETALAEDYHAGADTCSTLLTLILWIKSSTPNKLRTGPKPSPGAISRSIYSRLGYPVSEELETILRDAVANAQAHSSSHEYSYEAMGFSRAQIVGEFAHIFDRFEFDTQESREEQMVASAAV
ncbi:MAG TPA: hypothetical protein VGG45_04825 [Terracidiphilus sp.]